MRRRTEPVTDTDKAYAGILKLVLSHCLRPGERTSVAMLAEQLGLGRTPVKEAVTRLQTEGMLSVFGRSGTRVNVVDFEQARQIFALRRVLEDFAAEEAVKRATAQDIERLTVLTGQMRRQSLNSRGGARVSSDFVGSNVEFHALIVGAAGNKYLSRLYTQIQMHVQIVSYLISRGDDPSAAAKRQQEHEEILRAFSQRDAKRLKAALRSHAETTSRVVLQKLRAERGRASNKGDSKGRLAQYDVTLQFD
jgi:DNA-binding GntR family transcriptional regulator